MYDKIGERGSLCGNRIKSGQQRPRQKSKFHGRSIMVMGGVSVSFMHTVKSVNPQ